MKVSGNYSDLWKAIIRPPRDTYTLDSLGIHSFSYYFRTLEFQDRQ